MLYALGIEECRSHGSLYREIDILRNVAGDRSNAQCIELGNDDADHGAVAIEKWATAVSRLDRCRDLQEPAVVGEASQCSDNAGGDIAAGREGSRQRKAVHDDVFTL